MLLLSKKTKSLYFIGSLSFLLHQKTIKDGGGKIFYAFSVREPLHYFALSAGREPTMDKRKNFKRRYFLLKKAELLPELFSNIAERQGFAIGTKKWAENIAENGSEEELSMLERFFAGV